MSVFEPVKVERYRAKAATIQELDEQATRITVEKEALLKEIEEAVTAFRLALYNDNDSETLMAWWDLTKSMHRDDSKNIYQDLLLSGRAVLRKRIHDTSRPDEQKYDDREGTPLDWEYPRLKSKVTTLNEKPFGSNVHISITEPKATFYRVDRPGPLEYTEEEEPGTRYGGTWCNVIIELKLKLES